MTSTLAPEASAGEVNALPLAALALTGLPLLGAAFARDFVREPHKGMILQVKGGEEL